MTDYKIIFSKNNNELFLHFWKKFETIIENLKNVSLKNVEDTIELTYNTKKNATKTTAFIKQTLAECVVIFYKASYIQQNLNLPSKFNEYRNVLCKSLAVFDRVSEINEVQELLSNSQTVNVNSFYIFMLKPMRSRWDEICDLFTQNMSYLFMSNTFTELVKYLISTTESQETEVYVYQHNSLVYLRNKAGDNLSEPIKVGKNYVPEVVSELILLAPRGIYLKYGNVNDSELTETILDLFAEKVIVNA